MKLKLEKHISDFGKLKNKIVEYDIEYVTRNKQPPFFEHFHTYFYSIRDESYANLKQSNVDEARGFYEICGNGNPVLINDNIEAINLIERCIKYLQNHSHD